MKYQDYYEALGVSRTASQDDIQRAFRKLARKYHPDVNKEAGAEDRFKLVNEANEVIGDPEKRKRYDALGANWQSGQEFKPPPGFDFSQFKNQGGGGFEFSSGGDSGFDFSDFFGAVFGSEFGSQSSRGRQSAQSRAQAAGPFGAGSPFGAGAQHAGRTRQSRAPKAPAQDPLPLEVSILDLLRRQSKSISLELVTTQPDGSQQREKKQYEVKLRPGTKNGSVIRLKGQGPSGTDVLIRIQLRDTPELKLKDFDLIATLKVSPWEAVLGGEVELELPDGAVKLQVPAGARTGQRLRLRGRGLPKSDTERGDAYAQVLIVTPAEVSAPERELYVKLSEISPFNPRAQ